VNAPRAWPILAFVLAFVVLVFLLGRWAAVSGAVLAGTGPAILLARTHGSIRYLSLLVFLGTPGGALLLERIVHGPFGTRTLLLSLIVGLTLGCMLWTWAVKVCLDNQYRRLREQASHE
jgi:hypothetical protein